MSTLTARISSETLPIAKIRENLTYHRSADYVFWQIAKAAGNPPILLMDLRPVSYALCVVLSHDVAEQISRSSKQFPYSTPKSPTFQELVPIVGSHSIILSQVAIISLTGYILISLCDFIIFFWKPIYLFNHKSFHNIYSREKFGNLSARNTTLGSLPNTSLPLYHPY